MSRSDSVRERLRWAAVVARRPRLAGQPTMWLGPRTRLDLGPGARLAVAPGFVAQGDLQVVVRGSLEVGPRFYANRWCTVVAFEQVRIGADVRLGERVSVHDEDHAGGGYATAPVQIGDRVWLGAGVTVLRGVSIGAGTVVGAGAVVTRDLPAGVLAAGVPARVVRPLSPG